MKVHLAKWGNSTAVRLPKSVLDELGLKAGAEMELVIAGKQLILERQRRLPSGLTLAGMVAEMKRLGPENEPETVDWGPDVGEEIIDDGGYPDPDATPAG